jgi:putative beta-lysine N-acetyltransferase
LRSATEEDSEGISQLLTSVFPLYPVPTTPEYIKHSIQTHEMEYFIIESIQHKKIVSVAAAEYNHGNRSAEITDCATDPSFRGNNFTCHLINALEELLQKKDVLYLFSLTRAVSPSMNITVAKLGYRFTGTLINNCRISTGFEDMNVWVKPLSAVTE